MVTYPSVLTPFRGDATSPGRSKERGGDNKQEREAELSESVK